MDQSVENNGSLEYIDIKFIANVRLCWLLQFKLDRYVLFVVAHLCLTLVKSPWWHKLVYTGSKHRASEEIKKGGGGIWMQKITTAQHDEQPIWAVMGIFVS